MTFQIGARYTFDELRDQLGNLQRQQIFPQVGSEIVCALLTLDQNPNAPEEVLVGSGARMMANARRLASEGTSIPVFIKQPTNQWECRGRFHVSRMHDQGDPKGLRIWEQRRRDDEPGIVLYLEQDEPAHDEQHVTRYFTHYWTNQTWESQRAIGYERLDHAASNQFRKRGVEPGDLLYVITVIDGQLLLGGRMEVSNPTSAVEGTLSDFHVRVRCKS